MNSNASSNQSGIGRDAKPLHVFVAHRGEDSLEVKTLIRKIWQYCSDKVKFIMCEDIPPGEDWRKWILNNIADSNQLWLFYIDPKGKWEWPLYESGLYVGLKGGDTDYRSRLIYFYGHEEHKTDALANFQGVKAEEAIVSEFLHSFFTAPMLANDGCINTHIQSDAIDELTRMFMGLFAEPQPAEPALYNKYVDLEFSFYGKNVEDNNILSAKIESSSHMEDIFKITQLPSTWKELLETLSRIIGQDNGDALSKREQLSAWTTEVHEAVKSACAHVVFAQPTTKFVGLNTTCQYLPILHSAKEIVVSSEPPETRVHAKIEFIDRGRQDVKESASAPGK